MIVGKFAELTYVWLHFFFDNKLHSGAILRESMAYFLSSLHLYIDAFRDNFKITSTHDLQNNFYPCFLCFFWKF
ncbi:hypothetical protein HanXRQr2_Chr10g0463471 [Helianthus annuus]|uniref:Uncharacterized protein n=1 Tax=Helianthus annuus TaxID=4232 RepID=A0A251TR56_HELAN|nr:hypothetical protein HanXRQr2_Chr10g0463471 [Helianthus annuus]